MLRDTDVVIADSGNANRSAISTLRSLELQFILYKHLLRLLRCLAYCIPPPTPDKSGMKVTFRSMSLNFGAMFFLGRSFVL
jgi:hypothetical protein